MTDWIQKAAEEIVQTGRSHYREGKRLSADWIAAIIQRHAPTQEPLKFGKRLAGAIFDNQWARDTFETVILGALSRPFADQFEFKRFDYYDGSVEFWAYPGHDLDEIDRDVLWTLGFGRCWVCYRAPGSQDGEQATGEEHHYTAKGEVSIRPPDPAPDTATEPTPPGEKA